MQSHAQKLKIIHNLSDPHNPSLTYVFIHSNAIGRILILYPEVLKSLSSSINPQFLWFLLLAATMRGKLSLVI